MKLRYLLLAFAAFIATSFAAMQQPSFHTKGSPTGKPTGQMKPGEYWWRPQLSPSGPVVVLVSIPQQMMHVYRNGILIGRSTISSGRAGHDTPGGVFTILEKEAVHSSKTYNNAPMPFMQRLTSDGIAMHSGQLPGYAASHGCVRLPYDFSALLFQVTSSGGTVVVGNGRTPTPYLAANPGLLLAPKNINPGMVRPLAKGEYDWHPESGTTGPITIVMSSADKAVYVYRNGNPIGRAAMETRGRVGECVFTMLEGSTGKQSQLAPGREAKRWMTVGGRGDAEKVASKIQVSPEFAQKVADEIKPGTTILVTDRPVVRKQVVESYFAAN